MNEMTLNGTSMYDEVAEINQLNRVEGFDPRKYMRLIQKEGQPGKYYLDVAYRKLWFRLKYPEGKIVKKLIKLTDQVAIVEARVYLHRNDAEESFISNALAQKYQTNDGEFGNKYVELAETAAVGRALSDAGFGLQFADKEEDFDPDVTEAPIDEQIMRGGSMIPEGTYMDEELLEETGESLSEREEEMPPDENIPGQHSIEEYIPTPGEVGEAMAQGIAPAPVVNNTAADAEFGELPSGEQKVLSLITARLLAALGDAAVRNEVDVEFTCADTVFRAKTKNIREKGWREIQDWIIGSKADSTDSEEENEDKRGNAEMLACIAAMTNGRSYPLQNPKMEEGKTTPKKHFTEDSLLSAMERAGADEMPDGARHPVDVGSARTGVATETAERKGIGTSATRAATIEKLVRIGFVERKGNKKTKYLMPTHKGVALITVMPEQIQSPSMTAEWEQKLLDVEKGNFQDTEFMSEIEDMITNLVKTYKVIEDAEVLMHPAMEEIGICPCCGQHVIERQKGYSCENRGCNFVLWKQNRFFEALGKKMTKQTAIKLLTDGKVALKGCKSKKTGNTYDTTVVMTVDENQRAVFELNFEKGEAKYGKGKGKKN